MKTLYVCLLSLPLLSCGTDEHAPSNSKEFISGTFNGKDLHFTVTDSGDFSNAYYFDEVLPQDQLNLIRYSADNKKSIQLYIMGSQLRSRSFPLSLSEIPLCNIELQLLDFSSSPSCIFCPDDDYNYISGQEMPDVTIHSLDDNWVLSGTFKGEMATRTGKRMTVTNGKFRLRIVDVYGD